MAITLCLVPATASADGPPTIDGVKSPGEWDGATAFTGGSGIYAVYVLNDSDYLYVAFEANCGDYTIASSMTNTYIYDGDDWGGECWAYCAGAPGQVVGLTYFTTHHIPDPKVKEGQESRTTTAIVQVGTLVAEWQIPLSELPMGLGDSLAFDFLSYSEGCSGWNDWIFQQEFTLEANTLVGLTGETPQIVAINVDPSSIDFGTVKPGDNPSGPPIIVENIGTVAVVVDTTLNPQTGTVFNYLKLKGSFSPGYSGFWDNIISSLLPSNNQSLTTELDVPSTYSAQGSQSATLIFEATAK